MARPLALALLESHRAAEEEGSWALAPSQVRLDGEHAPFVLAACAAHGFGRHRLERVLVCAARTAPLDAAAALAQAAAGLGAHVARPGAGDPDALHLERFARPGALLLHPGGPTAAGAVGMLALAGDGVEIAGRLGGAPLWRPAPTVCVVRLEGAPRLGTGGIEVAVETARRTAWRGAIVEFHGPGVAALPIEDRIACVRLLTAWGAAAALFPSDERTRAWLRAAGRESDWRRLESDDARSDAAIALDALERVAADPAGPEGAQPLAALEGQRIARVLVGPALTAGALVRLARGLEGALAHSALELVVAPGTRRVLAAAEAHGALAVLTASGAHVLDVGAPFPGGVATTWFGCGAEGLGGGALRLVGAEAVIAAAVSGTARLSAEYMLGEALPEPGLPAIADDGVLEPVAGARADVAAEPPATRPWGVPLAGPLRGEVLAVLGDHVTMERILPWGARIEPLAADVGALAGQVLEGEDPGFAARARERGGAFVVAGTGFGGGVPRAQAAPALARLGVRAVITRGLAPAFRAALVRAGVLPLRFARAEDAAGFRRGSEIELPELPDGILPGAPVVARDLTRGGQVALAHDLAPREIEWLRAGGLLAWAAHAARAMAGEVR